MPDDLQKKILYREIQLEKKKQKKKKKKKQKNKNKKKKKKKKKRSHGSHKKRYKDTLKVSLKDFFNIPTESWKQIAQDRAS